MIAVETPPHSWRAWPPLRAGTDAILVDDAGAKLLVGLPAALVEQLVGLLNDGAMAEALEDLVLASGGPVLLARWLDAFAVLTNVGRVAPCVTNAEGDVLVLHAAHSSTIAPTPAVLPATMRLSRFAVGRADEQAFLLESPRASYTAALGPALCGLLPVLADGGLRATAVTDPLVGIALGLLVDIGLILDATDDTEDVGSLALWESHDLSFHWRTRRGGHREVNGATFSHRDRRPPLPTMAAWQHETVVPLLPMDDSEGPTLWSVLRDRATVRDAATPIDLDTLAQFLWWHRIVRDVPMDEARGIEYPQSRRTYPGGGATYELDLFLSTRDVAGLDDGLWFYDAGMHALVLVSADTTARDQLFADAEISTGGTGTPQVLITYGLRIGRNSWKYEGMAYRLALMDAGVLYHHAYLVGGALGIGICGLGNGDTTLFERIINRPDGDYVSIAEVMIVGMV